MWSKQQEDPTRTRPAANRSETSASEASFASGRAGMQDMRGIAVIGKGMVIRGQIKSAEHMYIAGEIDGSLNLPGYDVTLTADARVRADVTAREVEIAGSIQGNVDASRKITVRKGGTVIGDLRTPGIVIEDGAHFKGNIEIASREARQITEETAPAVPRAANASA